MLYELIGLLIMLRISAHISPRIKNLTVAVVIMLIAQTAMERLEHWLGTLDTFYIVRFFLSAAVYTSYPIILLLIMRITAEEKSVRKTGFLILIPLIVCVPIYFTSQWTHIVCYYTEENGYAEGFVYRLPYFVFAFYALVFVIHNLRYFKHYSRMNRVITTYLMLGAVAGVVVFLLDNRIELYGLLFATAIVLYYLCIYIHISKIDPLTRLRNRQSYYQDIKDYKDRITGVVSVDMNELKYLNDTFGHETGDMALKTVAGVLREISGYNGNVYRVGGDEFIILFINTDEEGLKKVVDEMRRNMDETSYTCAFGYAPKTQLEDLQAVIHTADERMYLDKARLKREVLEKGGTLHGRK